MELYGDILVNTLDDDNIRLEDFRSLAIHFEGQKNSLLSGKYYFHAKEYHKVSSTVFWGGIGVQNVEDYESSKLRK